MTTLKNTHWRIATKLACYAVIAATFSIAPSKTTGAQENHQPLPTGANLKLHAEFNTHRLKTFQKLTVDSYKRIGARDPAWDQQAIDYLDLRAHIFTATGPKPPYSELVAMGQAIIDAGCEDPLIAYLHAELIAQLSDDKESRELLAPTLQPLADSQYPLYWTAASRFTWQTTLGDESTNKFQVEQFTRTSEIFAETIASPEFTPNDLRFIFNDIIIRHFFKGERSATAAHLIEACQKRDDIPPWLEHMMKSQYFLNHAHEARRGEWGHREGAERTNAFRQNIHNARVGAFKAYELHPEFPEAATILIQVATVGYRPDGHDIRYWFDQAVGAIFDYIPAYNQMSQALLPGRQPDITNFDALQAFAEECTATERFDTLVPYHLFSTIRLRASIKSPNKKNTNLTDALFISLFEMLQNYIAAPNSAIPDAAKLHAYKISIAWSAKRYEDGRLFILNAGEQITPEPFLEVGTPMQHAINQTMANSGPWAQLTPDVQQLLRQAEFTKAIIAFRSLENKARLANEHLAADFFASQSWLANTARIILKGERAIIQPQTNLAGWTAAAGKWTVEKPGEITGVASTKGLKLIFDLPVGPEFELSGEIEFVDSQGNTNFNAGASFHIQEDQPSHSVLLSFEQKLTQIYTGNEPFSQIETKIYKTTPFRILVRNGKMDLYVGTRRIIKDQQLSHFKRASNAKIAIGSADTKRNAIVKFRKLRLRTFINR